MTNALNQLYGDIEDLGRADRYLDEILEIAHRVRLFDDLDRDEIRVICHYMRCYAAPRNYALLKEGASGDHLVLILTGMAELRKRVPGAGSEKITEVSAGSAIGEATMAGSQPRCVSCVATTPTDFAVLTRDALNHILLQAPRLGNKFLLTLLRAMSVHLREAYAHVLPGAVW